MIEDDGAVRGRWFLERLRPGLQTRDRSHLSAIQPPITTVVQRPHRKEHAEPAEQRAHVFRLREIQASADAGVVRAERSDQRRLAGGGRSHDLDEELAAGGVPV
jgi:hypothetical protein